MQLQKHANMTVDAALLLKRKGSQQDAPIDRELVNLLVAINDIRSVSKACEGLNCSTRYAQRMLKRFSDASGIRLLHHHGQQGTELTDEAKEFIALYASVRQCAKQIAMESSLFNSPPSRESQKRIERT